MPIQRLLIVACSATKRADPGELPALIRYDGPVYKVVRRFMRTHPEQALHLSIAILSAQYGLISASRPIPDYNRRMTPHRARALIQQVRAALETLQQTRGPFTAICICAGATYRLALTDIFTAPSVIVTRGGIGQQLSQLKHWLEG